MNYVQVVLKKDGIHWKRMKNMMQKEFKGAAKIAGAIVALILTIIHYAYLAMHTAYETALFIFNRPMFYANLVKLQESLITAKTEK